MDFGGKRWHVAPHTIMREMEHAADLLLDLPGGEPAVGQEDLPPMRVRVV